jgi:hypothetical protein
MPTWSRQGDDGDLRRIVGYLAPARAGIESCRAIGLRESGSGRTSRFRPTMSATTTERLAPALSQVRGRILKVDRRTGTMNDSLTTRQACATMFAFLDAIWERTRTDELAALLGEMSLLNADAREEARDPDRAERARSRTWTPRGPAKSQAHPRRLRRVTPDR